MLHADAGQAGEGFQHGVAVFGHQNDLAIQADQAAGPGGELAGQRDVHGAGNVRAAELAGGARIEHQRAFLLLRRDVLRQQALRNGKIGERRGAGAIQLRVLREIPGALGKFAGEQAHEFFPGFRLEGEVGGALLADGGTALRTHLAAAQGTGAVGRIDLHRIGQGQQLGVQTVVEQAGELLRGVIGREVGTSHVADEQRVAGEHGVGLGRALGIGDQ